MKKTNSTNNFSDLEQRLRELKPKATPEELTQKLLDIVATGQRKRRSWQQYWIPWTAVAALVVCFISLQWVGKHQSSSNTEAVVAKNPPTIQEFVKEQANEWAETTKLLADGCLEQAPAFVALKKLREEGHYLASAPRPTLPPPPPLNEHQKKLLENTDVFVAALVSGAPALPAIALATPVYVQRIKSEP